MSKSNILAAHQCARRLWLETRRPELRAFGAQTRRRFAEGQALSSLVQGMHPEGKPVAEASPAAAVKATAAHLAQPLRGPLFEAAFSAGGALVRVDIVTRGEDGYQLTELKSSTRVKAHHLIDCAVQTWVMRESGYPVQRTLLAHVDTRFRYHGDGDYSGLIKSVDVSGPVSERLPQVPAWIAAARDALRADDEPTIIPGRQCTSPFTCPFIDHCSPPTDGYPIEILQGGGRLTADLHAQGIHDVRDIPPGRLSKPLHERIRVATLSGQPFIDPQIRTALAALPYPRRYLDFEAIQFAIPRWTDTRPYEQIPFQWSCHIEGRPGQLRQREFLDTSGGSPLEPCAKSLLEALDGDGPIFTYSRFERSVINHLAARLPSLAPRLHRLTEHLFDLLPLLRAHYYHPAMRGSHSLKAVLPTVDPDLSYHDLGGVHDGVEAQIAYATLIDPVTPPQGRDTLARQLLAYCRLDTLAMVRLVRFFEDPTTGRPP